MNSKMIRNNKLKVKSFAIKVTKMVNPGAWTTADKQFYDNNAMEIEIELLNLIKK